MKYILFISTFFCIYGLSAQTPVFKSSISGSLGARVYDSDFGLGAGFDAGITLKVFDVSYEHLPLVFSISPYFNNFYAEDKAGNEARRDFLGFAGGIGLHYEEKIFALINLGHLFLLNSNTDRTGLEQTAITYVSGKGSFVFNQIKRSGISFCINGELGFAFTDIESLDRGIGDQFEGSTFVSITGGIIKFF